MSETKSSGGIGVLNVLGLIFVTLKLVGVEPVANWSWWWVTVPFWGGIALVSVVTIIIIVVASILNR